MRELTYDDTERLKAMARSKDLDLIVSIMQEQLQFEWLNSKAVDNEVREQLFYMATAYSNLLNHLRSTLEQSIDAHNQELLDGTRLS